jgi:sulfate transport system permease protein
MSMTVTVRAARWRNPSTLPGFGLALGFTIFYLSAIVLVPLAALIIRPWEIGWSGLWLILSDARVVHALRLSFGASFLAAAINTGFGLIVAWVLVRYHFPGKRLVDALVDLPFALPTAVAGIALCELYARDGWIGEPLKSVGVTVAYSPLGVVMALTFIGLPFVVRTLQPILADLGPESEEAASTLGATRFQTIRHVVLPMLAPALLTGAALAFARAVGEYGSVIFIAGNLPGISEIAPLLIVIKLNENDYAGAATIGVIMLGASFVMLLMLNALQAWTAARR